MYKFGQLLSVLVVVNALQAADSTWVRSYGESLASGSVFASRAGALVGRGSALIRIDAAGVPLSAVQLIHPWYKATTTPSGEVFSCWIDSRQSKVEILKLSRDFKSLMEHAYTFSEPVTVGDLTGAQDGGLFVAANALQSSIVIRLSSEGSIQWSVQLDPSDSDSLSGVAVTRDGGCVVVGSRSQHAWIVKLNKAGRIEWHRTFSYVHGSLRGVIETPTGDIVATGELGGQLAIVRLTAVGQPVWQRLFSGAQLGISIAETGAGTFVVGGTGLRDWTQFVVVEIKGDGSAGWKRRFAAPQGKPINLSNTSLVAISGPSLLVCLPKREGDDRVIVTALDAASGASSCEWWTDVGGAWMRGEIASEELPFETGSVKVTIADAAIVSTAVVASSFVETCSIAPRQSTPILPSASFDPLARIAKLNERYFALVREKKFDELEAEAERLRRERPFEDPLWWDIDTFYNAVVSLPGTSEAERIAAMKDWVASRPASITAKVALAKILERAGEERRGSGYSDSVTGLAWREYSTFLTEAQETLGRAGKAGEADPQYWMMMISFEHLLSDLDVRETARRAAKLHHHPRIFITASSYMLPKWGGTPTKYLEFADEAGRLTASTYGDGLYAVLALSSRFEENYDRDFVPKIDWNRVRRGYRDLITMAPAWAPTYHAFARIARFLNDRPLARELFEKPQLAWYEGAQGWEWKSRYDAVREWALSKPAEPFLESADSKWPDIMMQAELVMSTGTRYDVGSFFIETPSGIAAVSVVPQIPNRSDHVNTVREAEQHLSKWTLWPPGQPRLGFKVSIATVHSENSARATLLTLPPSKAHLVYALKPRATDWISTGTKAFSESRRFIVGCTWTNRTCVQTVIEAESAGGSADSTGRARLYKLAVRDAVPKDAFVGGAVLDEDGRVVGVVTSQSPSWKPEFSTFILADDLSMVIAGSMPKLPLKE